MNYSDIITDKQRAGFSTSYDIDPVSGCWLWNKKARHEFGYGLFSVGRYTDKTQRQVTAHRLSYELAHGSIPEGAQINHKCDVPHCVNPAHLYAGTQKQNIQDAINRRRANFFKHPFGETHCRAKLTDADVVAIRASAERGTVLSRRYGVSPAHICGIRKGRYRAP
jgi:hypothetical protein